MTERANDSENPSENPSRPEGQDTSEAMDNTTEHDTDTTAVLPPAQTPPTQQITPPTQPVPEGEVHPAYGIAAARVQEEADPAASVVQDAPVEYPGQSAQAEPALAEPGLPEPAPAEPTQQLQPVVGPAQPQPVQAQPTQAQPAPQVQPAAQAAAKRGPRVGTAVWGLIVIAVGLGILAVAAGVTFDVGVALIVLLGAAGVILVVGSVISSIRRR